MAGAFSIDGFGAPFVEGIDGDWGTVAGLSLPLPAGEPGGRITFRHAIELEYPAPGDQ